MIVKRKESWGELLYKIPEHSFEYSVLNDNAETPYPSAPIVLNIDLTFQCNMKCKHCVAKDLAVLLGGMDKSDLNVTDKLINEINKSPFMVIVITGGEPLLTKYKINLTKLVCGLKNKGIIIDTNGTIALDKKTINIFQKKHVMVRVSWDLPIPAEECKLRQYPTGMFSTTQEYMDSKEKLIKYYFVNQLPVAIQTVITNDNYTNSNLFKFSKKLAQLGVKKWYLQRFIPSHHLKDSKKYLIDSKDYEWTVKKISIAAKKDGIECITKLDRRHNSVFLLVKDGDLYTQSEHKTGGKVYLGKLGKIKHFFEFVSSPDHSVRYCPNAKI